MAHVAHNRSHKGHVSDNEKKMDPKTRRNNANGLLTTHHVGLL